MSVQHVYRSSAQAVLLAARDLEEALDASDEEDIPSLAANLLSVALARESSGVVAGFLSSTTASADAVSEPATAEEELSLALTELEIGGVLLSGSAAVGLRGTEPGTLPGTAAPAIDLTATLGEAVDNLQDSTARLADAGSAAVTGLFSERKSDPEEFFTQLPETVGHIVDRTVEVGRAAVTGLTRIPAAQLQPVFTSALSLIPDVGALARAGMRAVRRAIDALAGLVSAELLSQVREWAKQWWEQHVEGVFDGVIRRALSVAGLEAAMKTTLAAARQRPELPDGPLLQGISRLQEIDERHSRVIKIIGRIVSALSRLIGPLVALLPAAALWIYLSGGGGLLTALGVAVWVGRDSLGTGVPFGRAQGVGAVLMMATA